MLPSVSVRGTQQNPQTRTARMKLPRGFSRIRDVLAQPSKFSLTTDRCLKLVGLGDMRVKEYFT
jgi:hypothetical protein